MSTPAGRDAALAALLTTGLAVHAQSFRLRTLGGDQGLTSTFVHALAQDAQGRLWIGTGEGAGRFDGRTVTLFTVRDSMAEDYVASLCATADSRIWAGHNEGGISWLAEGRFHKARTAGIDSSTVRSIVPDGRGGIWAAAQNEGIVHVAPDGRVQLAARANGVLWYALLALDDGRVLAGASDGLHLFQGGANDSLMVLTGVDQVTHAPVHALVRADADGTILAGTEDEGIIRFGLHGAEANGIATLGEDLGLGALQVRSMSISPGGLLLVGTAGQGAYEADLKAGRITALQHYGQANGLGTDQVEAVLLDREDNAWFARPGLGLARLLDRDVTWYAAAEGHEADVQALLVHGPDAWFGTVGGILHYRTDGTQAPDTLRLPDAQAPVDALLLDPAGRLIAGTAAQGLFRQADRGAFTRMPYADDRMSLQVHALALVGKTVWAATSNGVYILDSTGTRHLTTENGLMHNRVNHLLVDRRGRIWMACNNGGVSMVQGDTVRSFTLTRQGNAYHVTGVAEARDGTLWFSTAGSGVWYSAGDEFHQVSAAQGLRSDFCYGIAADGNGGIWSAHRGGVSRIDARSRTAQAVDRQLGIDPDRRVNAVQADGGHRMWFATDAGVIRYDASKDRSPSVPPSVVITAVKVFGKDVPPDQALDLQPDIYRLQFDFTGISLKQPEAIRYRFMLEGHDMGWTETRQLTAQYMRVQDGDYVFKVEAAWADGSWSPAATLHVTVRAPFWKKAWFIAACALLLLAAIFTVVWARERNQRIAKERLQRALDERTHELKTKKEELEEKNKDITASITYARRIQQAILPATKGLTDQFAGAFILYRPRDIVSGDFYWFRRFGTKFILACADCTGHGVPGAFMSMIGSMLLREVSADREVNAPDVLLRHMDRELRSVLQYQGEEAGSRDGMDISICEIDLDSRMVRFSAAMHDLLVVRGGQLLRERGSRKPIGGAASAGQDFARTEIQLAPGDRIYLFTDGMPDQFGGQAGKKLKVNGVMDWIGETSALSMTAQAEALRERFITWQGTHDQVDDVLMIGVQL